MHSNVETTPPATIENAVRETMRSVNTNAFFLLKRQSEINRRIRDLHRVIRQLRRLAANPEFNNRHTLGAQRAPGDDFDGTERDGLRKTSSLVQSRHSLSRACRIALLESGGPAALEDIRSRIIRRSSFSFPDAAGMNMAILRTLTRMTREGEVLSSGRGPQQLWRRIEWRDETDADAERSV